MIRVISVGKVKDKNLKALIDDYALKINRYHKLEMIEVKDESITSDEKKVLDIEAERVLDKIGNDEYVVLLDLHGKMMDSVDFAHKIDQLFVHYSKVTFVIGGSLGLGDKLLERGNERLKLSDMTFLHQMSRLIILEQIYRGFKILNNEVYHK
ncbi:MAG: 23S rRNA (pseudouridine(1915)-N(3))-methyltransferase RlmH [Erysipelotrichaceae bacterium]|nr:23S rRNA (pseudouridine(1915)-N(3))-methyltransferase RlmH [Erysipelotrichaceae bacterium]